MIERVQVPGRYPDPRTIADVTTYAGLAFISGCTPLDQDMNVIGGDDLERQTDAVFERLRESLEVIGAEFSSILHLTQYLTDMSQRDIYQQRRRKNLENLTPSSTLIGVNSLAVREMKIEVSAIAACPR